MYHSCKGYTAHVHCKLTIGGIQTYIPPTLGNAFDGYGCNLELRAPVLLSSLVSHQWMRFDSRWDGIAPIGSSLVTGRRISVAGLARERAPSISTGPQSLG